MSELCKIVKKYVDRSPKSPQAISKEMGRSRMYMRRYISDLENDGASHLGSLLAVAGYFKKIPFVAYNNKGEELPREPGESHLKYLSRVLGKELKNTHTTRTVERIASQASLEVKFFPENSADN